MLGGFVVGGLLGSLLFGHGGWAAPGFGLLDLLLVAGLGVLLVAWFRRRLPEPGGPPGYGGGRWQPGSDVTTPGGAGDGAALPWATTTPALGDGDLARGVAAIRTMDPGFDPTVFEAVATDLFTRLQIGWSGEDLAAVRAHLTDEMAVALEKDLARLQGQGRRNRVEGVQVDSAEVTEAWQEYGRDLVTVRFRARALDYTVEGATGQVLEGSRTAPVAFEEYWTFVRPVGPNPWRLGAIQQPTTA
jgi:predicted lipid-binding transport protein (Tim44 family)